MKPIKFRSLILFTALIAGCSVENPTPQYNHSTAAQKAADSTIADQPSRASSKNDEWTFTTQIDKMNDTVKRRLQSTSINGEREYVITGYCDDFQMGLSLTPSNFSINDIEWRYGLPGFAAPFIKVGIRTGDSSASTYALQSNSEISILLNSREQKDYIIILDRPNSLADIASDPEFKRISKSLYEYLAGTFEGNKLLFNGVFPDETIEFSPPSESSNARSFLNSCKSRVQQLNSPQAIAAESVNEEPSAVEAEAISRFTETVAPESLEASDGGDGFYFSTANGKQYYVTSNSDQKTPGADLVQNAANNQLPLCLTVAGEDLVRVDPGTCD